MKKKRFTKAQIVNILKEGEAGMSISDLKRLKSLEEENHRLKRMYADLSLVHEMLKDIIEKKLNLPLSDES